MLTQEKLQEKLEQEIKQLIIFELGNEEFATSIEQIREIVGMMQITHMPNVPDFIEGIINLRGTILPIIDLKKRLELPITDDIKETKTIMWVELNDGEHQVGMIVDKVTEVIEIPFQAIDDTPWLITSEVDTEYISGVAKIGEDGERLLILLDLSMILTHKEKVQLNNRMSEDSLDE